MSEPKTLTVTYEATLAECRRSAEYLAKYPDDDGWAPITYARAAAYRKWAQEDKRYYAVERDTHGNKPIERAKHYAEYLNAQEAGE